MAAVIHKALARVGLKLSRLPSVQTDFDLYQRLYSAETLARKPFYNVGAGSFFHPHWTNIDFVSDWYKGVQKNVIHHDLMKCEPLPIENAEVIYTSHTVEHVSDAAVSNLLRESYRALKKGGTLRVTTGPDADLDYAAMMRGDKDYFYWDEMYRNPKDYEPIYHAPPASMPIEERWLSHVASQLAPNYKSASGIKFNAEQIREIVSTKSKEDALDYFTGLCKFDAERPGSHMSWWNREKMIRCIKEAGFEKVWVSGYGQSHCPILRNTAHFDNTHPAMSIYIEAVK